MRWGRVVICCSGRWPGCQARVKNLCGMEMEIAEAPRDPSWPLHPLQPGCTPEGSSGEVEVGVGYFLSFRGPRG